MGLGRDIAYAVGAAVGSPVWGFNLLRTGKWRTDWRGRFGRTHVEPDNRPTVLFHAVSVGETNLIRELVRTLAADRPDLRIVVASTTNTGYERSARLYHEQHTVARYPLDFSRCVNRFLDRVRPDVAALVELEVWPNFIEACDRRGIPVCIVNGRLSERSFKRYRMIRPLIRPTFARLAAAAMQTQVYADRIIELGAPAERVRVLDTMKWDAAEIADTVAGTDELAEAMGIDRGRPLIVAGSTGTGEERMLIDQCPAEAQLMLVPRKPERFDEVAALDPTMVRRTQPPAEPGANGGNGRRVFLLDTMGELKKAYALADVVIVGRSFNGWGASDPIEPIALGRPTIIGPDHQNFQDVVDAFRGAGGIVVTKSPGEAAAKLLADRDGALELARRGREVILSRQGSTRRHAEMLLELLNRKRAD